MLQFGTGQQARGVFRLGIRAGGTWLGCLGIFAGLLWLSARMPARPSTEEKPAESVREDRPGRPPPLEEKDEPFGTDSVLDPSILGDDPCRSSPSNDVVQYGAGMVPPVLIYGEQLQYPREALEANLQGLIIAKCTITCQGEVKDCRIIKGLPYMNQAALAMLESRRYRPAYSQGRPITVSYAFSVRVNLPEGPRGSPRRSSASLRW